LALGNYIGIHRVKYRNGEAEFSSTSPRRYRLASPACAAWSCIFLHGKARRARRYARDIKLPLRVRSLSLWVSGTIKEKGNPYARFRVLSFYLSRLENTEIYYSDI